MTRLFAKDIIHNGLPFGVTVNRFFSNSSFRMHDHDYFEFILVTQGKLKHTVNDKVYNMKEGALCLIRPEDKHTIYNPNIAHDLEIINCTFTQDLMDQVLSFISKTTELDLTGELIYLDNVPAAIWNAMIYKIKELALPSSPDSTPFKIAEFKSTLIEVLLLLCDRNQNRDKAPSWLKNACKKMNENENYLKGLDYFIKLSGKTQEHLSRTIKKHYEMTTTEFINSLKVQRAAELLTITQMSVWEIMEESGFSNLSHFRKCFVKNYGVPPKKYAMQKQKVF